MFRLTSDRRRLRGWFYVEGNTRQDFLTIRVNGLREVLSHVDI